MKQRDVINNAFKIIELFENSPRGVTVRDVANKLDLTWPNAHHWVTITSLRKRIYEDGRRHFPTGGRGAKIYKILKDKWGPE